MNPKRALIAGSVRTAGAISPTAGAALAMPIFSAVARPRSVRAADQPTMWRARRRRVRVAGVDGRGVEVTAYEWGDGPRTVALLHGWDGRTSQFATLVRELAADGFRVVAFDAPAHGDSAGRRTYLVDWIAVLTQLQDRYGAYSAMVGHSFGGLAALVGVAGGVRAERVVTVAAPSSADALLTAFQRTMQYSDRVAAEMRRRFAKRYFPEDPDPFAWLSAVRRPLPHGIPLLVVHDQDDRMVPVAEASRITAANAGARSLVTHGLGHNRVLVADPFLDAVLSFVGETAAAAAVPEPPHGAEARAAGRAAVAV